MADFFDALDERHMAMIAAQPVFFVATAAEGARINLSPKGYDCLRVLSPTRVAYLDLGGSGNETNAHLLADGRFTLLPGTRQIFDIAVESVQTSCGWGVPFMAFEQERKSLIKHHAQADPREW